jgi:glycosyltransferase involved in cell wall biosynthesis
MKNLFKGLFHRLGFEIHRHKSSSPISALVSLLPDGSSKGQVLLSYIVEPLLANNNSANFNTHTHFWESAQIARIFVNMGYSVDVIDYRNSQFFPFKRYDYFIGARTNFERISRLINKNCRKIVHLDTAHWAFNNQATYTRLLNLVDRRGFCPRGSLRIIEQNSAIEYADHATILGNKFTKETYSFCQKPIYSIPISTCATYSWNENKDFKSCSRNFLWFGSAGAVHRGLDMLLEVFSKMPDFHLYICGPIEKEKEFVEYYSYELFNKPNIHLIGWVNVESDKFCQILEKCCTIIFPSCAEGQCGSVINCMHAGLIPVVSKETGIDVDEFGHILQNCSIYEIEQTLELVASTPPDELKKMSRQSWEFVNTEHTRENFSKNYCEFIENILFQ